VAIQYSISYDSKGNPSLVKNTIEGSKPVVKTSFNIGEYKPVRTIQTNFDFDSINNETVYQSLQKYIYQNENNSDDSPKQSEQDKFLKQSFEATAAKDDDGKVIGGSTFKEKIKMAAVNAYVDSKLNPIKSIIIGQVPVIGTIHKVLSYAGSQYVDPYYDPADDYYYSTGFGMYDDSRKAQAARDDRLTSSGGIKIDNAYMYGSDYQGSDYQGSDYQGSDTSSKVVEQMNQAAAKAAMTSNAAYTGGGADRDQEDRSPGSTGRGGSDEMGSF